MAICPIKKSDFSLIDCFDIDSYSHKSTIVDNKLIILQSGFISEKDIPQDYSVLVIDLMTKEVTKTNITGEFLNIFTLNDRIFIVGNEDISKWRSETYIYEISFEDGQLVRIDNQFLVEDA